MRWSVVWGLTAIGIAAAGFAARHGVHRTALTEPPLAAKQASEASLGDSARPGHAGMRVAIEPETGELVVPSPAQQKAMDRDLQEDLELQEMLSRSDEGLHEEVLPDGTGMVHLQGRFQNASVAVIDAEGNLHTTCVENHEGAQAELHGATPVHGSHCRHTPLEEK